MNDVFAKALTDMAEIYLDVRRGGKQNTTLPDDAECVDAVRACLGLFPRALLADITASANDLIARYKAR